MQNLFSCTELHPKDRFGVGGKNSEILNPKLKEKAQDTHMFVVIYDAGDATGWLV